MVSIRRSNATLMHKDFYKIEVEKATGEITTLEEYKGKVI
jgi:glutathione peroxidase-family protein